MNDLLELIIPKAHAQEFDAISQPTFGPLDVDGTSSITGSVLLRSDKTSVEVGESFKVEVELKTNDINITEYRIVIDYDPSKFSVIDANADVGGTQVGFLDTIFTIEDPATDNTVDSLGRIRLSANSSSAQTINADIIEITFQAQQNTSGSTVRIVEGSVGTQILRQAGVGMAYTSNEVSVQVANNATATTGNTTNNNNGTTTTGTPSTTGVSTVTVIPDTAIGDDLGLFISIFAGLIFIILGMSLVIRNGKDDVTINGKD